MEIIRVHPQGFKFLFYLYHGSAVVGFILVTGFLLQIIPYDNTFVIGILMISIPYLLVPPELIILLKDQQLIFRNRNRHVTIPFKNISRLIASDRLIVLKDYESQTILEIHKNHFKNINLYELSEYIINLLSGHRRVDPLKYTSIKFTWCKLSDWCKSAFKKKM